MNQPAENGEFCARETRTDVASRAAETALEVYAAEISKSLDARFGIFPELRKFLELRESDITAGYFAGDSALVFRLSGAFRDRAERALVYVGLRELLYGRKARLEADCAISDEDVADRIREIECTIGMKRPQADDLKELMEAFWGESSHGGEIDAWKAARNAIIREIGALSCERAELAKIGKKRKDLADVSVVIARMFSVTDADEIARRLNEFSGRVFTARDEWAADLAGGVRQKEVFSSAGTEVASWERKARGPAVREWRRALSAADHSRAPAAPEPAVSAAAEGAGRAGSVARRVKMAAAALAAAGAIAFAAKCGTGGPEKVKPGKAEVSAPEAPRRSFASAEAELFLSGAEFKREVLACAAYHTRGDALDLEPFIRTVAELANFRVGGIEKRLVVEGISADANEGERGFLVLYLTLATGRSVRLPLDLPAGVRCASERVVSQGEFERACSEAFASEPGSAPLPVRIRKIFSALGKGPVRNFEYRLAGPGAVFLKVGWGNGTSRQMTVEKVSAADRVGIFMDSFRNSVPRQGEAERVMAEIRAFLDSDCPGSRVQFIRAGNAILSSIWLPGGRTISESIILNP